MSQSQLKDFTVFLTTSELQEAAKDASGILTWLGPTQAAVQQEQDDQPPPPSASPVRKGKASLHIEVKVQWADGTIEWKDGLYRAVFCWCFRGDLVSCTFREIKTEAASAMPTITLRESQLGPKMGPSAPPDLSGYWIPKDTTEWRLSKPENTYLFASSDIAQLLYDSLEGTGGRHGLIVVSGRTKCGKSTIARQLVHLLLMDEVKNAAGKGIAGTRRPHLVTFEDPIEERFDKTPAKAAAKGIDYTARDLNADTTSLAGGLKDSLRQTPAVVYVGEVRDREDWESILDFASTGHLCVTTTHAGSLCETMRTLFEVRNTSTADARSSLASRLLMVVHLETVSQKVGESEMSSTLPALWRRTPRGVSGLVSDGLASLVPQPKNAEAWGSLGRQSLAGELLTKLDGRLTASKETGWQDAVAGARDSLFQKAVGSDIQGM